MISRSGILPRTCALLLVQNESPNVNATIFFRITSTAAGIVTASAVEKWWHQPQSAPCRCVWQRWLSGR
jgi:hypothetical protein